MFGGDVEALAEKEAEAKADALKAAKAKADKRAAKIAEIKASTGSTVLTSITDASHIACADLLAGHLSNITVHHVKAENLWGTKFTVWYRTNDKNYTSDQYNTRNCKISGGSVKILGVFEKF